MEPRSSSKPKSKVDDDENVAVAPSSEGLFSVKEIAARWKLSRDFVRRVFEREPGVLVFGGSAPRGTRRRYRTLRIPQAVLLRVERMHVIVDCQKSGEFKKSNFRRRRRGGPTEVENGD